MKRFYQAGSLQEAYLLRDLLAQAGIDVLLFNENALGAQGQLPFTEIYPELWLREPGQLRQAEQILATYERGNDTTQPCPHCGEENPGNFEVCWQCGEPLR